MKDVKNILIVVKENGDPKLNPAVIRGISLAQQNQARVTLMDVVNPPDGLRSAYRGLVSAEELSAMLVKEREDALGQIAELFDEKIDVTVKVAQGKDFIEVVRQVILGKHDLLIKQANDNQDGFDSRDFHLMRKCPVPVWLLKAESPREFKKVLVAVDLGLESEQEGQALNSLILDLATSLSGLENSELHVLSCWSLYGENSLRYSGFLKVSEERIAEMIEDEKQANQTQLEAVLNRYPNQQLQAHLVKGDPVQVIPEFVSEQGIDVVIMGTVARGGISGLLIGNTAESILKLIDSSVITVKPNNFISPIQ